MARSAPLLRPLTGMIVRLPWGSGTANDDDGVRCGVERLGGRVAYAQAPAPGYGAYGMPLEQATHEYVPDEGRPETTLPVLSANALRDARQAAAKEVIAWLAPLRRPVHVPVVAPVAKQGAESRYFGAPWLPEGFAWPTRQGDRMRFVMQLNTATAPQELTALGGRTGLLLVFHSEHYEDGPGMSHVVLVDPTGPGAVEHVPGLTDTNPALAIVGWKETVDLPNEATLETLDGYNDAFSDALMDVGSDTWRHVKTPDGAQLLEREAIEQAVVGSHHTYACDKLGGWPDWEQGDETPQDRNDDPMDYVLQIGHEGLLFIDPSVDADRIDWPTWGRGQVFWSARTGEGAYVWACD